MTQIFYLQASEEEPVKNKLPDDVRRAVVSLSQEVAAESMPAILTLGKDGDKGVSLKALTTHLIGRGFGRVSSNFDEKGKGGKRREENAARMDKLFIASLQTDDKGDLYESGFAKGITNALSFRLMRTLPLDLNQDGKLTMAEFAPSVAITKGEEKDADGFSKRQRERFARADKDNNQLIEGIEHLGQADWIRHVVKASMATIYIHRADKDENGTLSGGELKVILPEAETLPESVEIKQSIYWLRSLEPKQILAIESQLLNKKN